MLQHLNMAELRISERIGIFGRIAFKTNLKEDVYVKDWFVNCVGGYVPNPIIRTSVKSS